MEINEIETNLNSAELDCRLKALTALKDYDADVSVPLLLSRIRDKEFLARSFVAMGLGRKQTADSFAALLEMLRLDRDPNVRAEASNSLSLFGQVAASHLVQAFLQDDHWLVRRSILAALLELDCPGELFEVCLCGLEGEDQTVREASLYGLVAFVGTPQQQAALQKVLSLTGAEFWRTRRCVAGVLRKFENPEAREALLQLRQDDDSRVVAAVLESLI